MKDVVRKLAEPLAYLLIGYVALQYLIGLGQILIGPKTSYSYAGGSDSYSAYPFAERLGQQTSTYLSVYVLVAVVAAVLLVTVLGVTAHARLIVFGAVGTLGVGVLLGLICAVGALFQKHTIYYGNRAKTEDFLGYLVLLAIFVVVGLVLFQLTSTSALAATPKPAGYGQQQNWGGYQGGQQGGYGQQGGWPQQGQQPAQAPQPQQGQPQQGQPQQGQQAGWPQQGGWPQH